MANITVTYSFTNGTTADAGEVNTNFTDIINGTSDGTKDFSISALTCAGTATFNGAVNLGNATSDDITFTGYIASSLIPKTSAASDLGSSTLNWQALYLDNDSTDGGAIYFDAGTTEYLKATADGTQLDVGGFTYLDTNGTIIKTATNYHEAKSASYTITDSDGVAVILMTTASTDRTVTLPTAADNTGRMITIKKVDSGTGMVTIDGEGSETIDGETTLDLYQQYNSVSLICDGTGWHITGSGTYFSEPVTLNGSLTGTLFCARHGDMVILTGDGPITHASAASASSNAGVIPAKYRPSASFMNQIYFVNGTRVHQCIVESDGTITFDYWTWAGATSATTTTAVTASIAYNIV